MNNGTLHSYPIVGDESESLSFAMIYCDGFDIAFRDISTFSARISSRRSISQSYPMDCGGISVRRPSGREFCPRFTSVRPSRPETYKSAREWNERITTRIETQGKRKKTQSGTGNSGGSPRPTFSRGALATMTTIPTPPRRGTKKRS